MNGIRTLLNDIEGIQASFLRFPSRNDQQALTMNYKQRCNHFNVERLDDRRLMASAMFCFKTITGMTDSEYVLSRLNFNCPPRRLRNEQCFRTEVNRSNYAMCEPVNVLMSCLNVFKDEFDYDLTVEEFKRRMKLRLSQGIA